MKEFWIVCCLVWFMSVFISISSHSEKNKIVAECKSDLIRTKADFDLYRKHHRDAVQKIIIVGDKK